MKYHYFTRVGDSLKPLDQEARDAMKRIPLGEVRRIRFHHVRNQANHNRLMALCQLIVDNTRFETVDEVLDELALLGGYYRTHIGCDGKVTRIPHSIDHETLDELAFSRIWERYKAVTAQWILPGLGEEGVDSGVMRELQRLVGQPMRRRA